MCKNFTCSPFLGKMNGNFTLFLNGYFTSTTFLAENERKFYTFSERMFYISCTDVLHIMYGCFTYHVRMFYISCTDVLHIMYGCFAYHVRMFYISCTDILQFLSMYECFTDAFFILIRICSIKYNLLKSKHYY